MLLGYDEMGRCPMLVESRCSIYPNRPQTCRSFDCRVFSAAGLAAGGSDKTVIDERVRRWRFNYPREIDRTAQAAVETAAAFLREHAARFPAAFVPGNPAQVAVLAIKVYEVFLDGARAATDEAVIRAVIEKAREFDSRTVGRG